MLVKLHQITTIFITIFVKLPLVIEFFDKEFVLK